MQLTVDVVKIEKHVENAALPQGRVEPQLQATLDLIPSHTWWASASGVLTFVNESFSDYLGLPENHPLRFGIDAGAGWDSHIPQLHPDDQEEARRVWSNCLHTGFAGQVSFRVSNAEGGYRWFLSRAEPVRASDGTLLYWIGVNLDIEDRKEAEFYLAEGQRLAHMGSWAFNAAGFHYWSPELFRMHGLHPSGKAPTVEEYMGLVHPEDREFVAEIIRKMLAEGRGFDFTKRIVRPDGEIRSIRCVGVPASHGGTIHGTGVDVTGQEQLTEELRRSEFYLAEGQRLSRAGSWSFKPDLTCDYWSRELYEILGFAPRNGIPTISDYFTRVHPEDRAVVEATIQGMIAAGEGCDLKKRIIRPDGVQRVIRCVGMPVRENGVVTRFVGTLMDITEQEELTQELRRREAYLAEAQRLSHTGSFGWNVVTGEVTWSEENYRILDYDRLIKPTFELVRDRVHPDDLQKWQQAFARASEGKQVDFEHRLVMPDGSVKFLHVVAYGVQKDGKFVELVGTSMDITGQKQIEDRLRRSERNLAEGQRLTKTGSWILDWKTGNTDWSVETCRIFGFPDPPPSPHYGEFRTRVRPEDRESVDRALRESFETGEPRPLEYIFVLPNGIRKNIETISQPVRDKTGTVVRLMGTVMDVTERKQAQEAIRRSEAFLAEGQRLSHTGSWGWNASSGKVTWSQEHFRILGLDPQNTNPSLKVFWERVHPDDRIGLQRTFESAIRDKSDFEQEFRIVTPDWSIRHLHGVGHAILNEASELVEFIGSAMDITERKRAEERVQSQREAIRLALNAFVEKLDVSRFLEDIIAEITKRFHPKSWELWLFDEALGELSLQLSSHSADSRDRVAGNGNIRRPKELADVWRSKYIARTPQVFEIPVKASTPVPQHFEMLHAKGVKRLVLVPLVMGGQNLGFLELHFQSSGKFTTDDLELAQALVNHATLALQLSRLAHRTEQLAVMEERNRMAREIHDTLAQAFAGVVLHSEALGTALGVNKSRSEKALFNIQKLARSGLEEARRSVQALRPRALEGSTLTQALAQEAKRLSADGKFSCEFKQKGEALKLSAEIQNELFRIAQEAMTNINKHAQAKSVWITLEFKDNQAILTVRDDGVGFAATDSPKPKGGYGLSTMRERAQRIGGQIEIKSPDGGGTVIRVLVPLTEKERPSDQTI